MKKILALLGLTVFTTLCFSASVFATGKSDVYIGVTTMSHSNVIFQIVDEKETPIESATIDIWANDLLEYQLLGVSLGDGTFSTYFPLGEYRYRVYKAGYKEANGTVSVGKSNGPIVVKVVLKKELQEGGAGEGNTIVPPGKIEMAGTFFPKTGDGKTPLLLILALAGSGGILLLALIRHRKRREPL